MNTSTSRLVPVYTTRGDLGAYLLYPYLYSRQGEWIGWVTPDRWVYSVHGHYVGWLSDDPRVLRRQSDSFGRPRRDPPALPVSIRPPATAPLAPLMPELAHGIVDVLQDDPDLLPPVDFGDLREDMD